MQPAGCYHFPRLAIHPGVKRRAMNSNHTSEVTYPLYSCDDHMDLRAFPRDLWTSALPARLAERAPRVESIDGRDWWVYDGRPFERWGPRGPEMPSPYRKAGIEDTAPRMRASTPALRLEDLDRDGVQASVIYGPLFWPQIADPELHLACVRVFNDWALAFTAHCPERFVMLPCVPTVNSELAVSELERVARAGARGVQFIFHDAGREIFTPAWERLWEVAQAAGVPFSFHISGGTAIVRPLHGSWEVAARACILQMQMDEGLVAAIFSGVLERHPDLKLVLGESGIGWLPFVLERMDEEYHKYRGMLHDYQIQTLPTEQFARQVVATFQDDPVGVALIERIGVDNVMWASDYPHGDSTWPFSRQAVAKQFAGVPEETFRKATRDTCLRLYGFP
jgi:predicted TIM-barrel fold metal-dependent hydrolase